MDKKKRKNLALFTAITLVLGLFPPSAFMASDANLIDEYTNQWYTDYFYDGDATSPGALNVDTAIPQAMYSSTVVNSHQELLDAINGAPTTSPDNLQPTVIEIGSDFHLTAMITINQGRNIHLVSHGTDLVTGQGDSRFTLSVMPNARHFTVAAGTVITRGNLTLSNIILDGGVPVGEMINRGGVIAHGVFTMRDNAVIRNCRAVLGGAVQGNGLFEMHGNAQIYNNSATNGGAVHGRARQ